VDITKISSTLTTEAFWTIGVFIGIMTENVFDKHRDKLAGVWSLLSFEFFDSEGPDKKLVRKPHGDKGFGRVVISPAGYLSGILASPAVMDPLPSDDWAAASDEEVVRISRGFNAYSGPMTLHEREDGGLLWHTNVEIALNPNWIGKQQTRRADYWEEDGISYMTLRPVRYYLQPVS
jgi:hypothetical protein